MYAAELVQFVVDLVENEGLVVVGSVVLHYIIHWGVGGREAEETFQNKRRQHLKLARTEQFSLPEVL